jgi:hypothetical protein
MMDEILEVTYKKPHRVDINTKALDEFQTGRMVNYISTADRELRFLQHIFGDSLRRAYPSLMKNTENL